MSGFRTISAAESTMEAFCPTLTCDVSFLAAGPGDGTLSRDLTDITGHIGRILDVGERSVVMRGRSCVQIFRDMHIRWWDAILIAY